MGFAGTIAIRPTVLIEFLKDVCHSLHRHGFDKILVINGHGGTVEPAVVALEEFHYETGALAALVKCWQLWAPEAPAGAPAHEGHAGRQETELMLALSPGDVDTEAYVPASPTSELGPAGSVAPMQYTPMDSAVRFPVSAWESSATGHYGDPSMASRERGQLVLDKWTEKLAELFSAVKDGTIKITTRTGEMPRH
jgi:creatinine amidohydrolase